MEINPLDQVEGTDEPPAPRDEARKSRLNTRVAITVALLATFTGVCKVKDDNIVQAMQQVQADRVDDWNYYQAKNLREEIAHATADELRAEEAALPRERLDGMLTSAARYDSLAANEAQKKEQVRRKAEEDQRTYDALNYRDDQFDLSDTLVALAISLLALTSLTQKRWLFSLALVPTFLGVLMGLAGLAGWKIHPDALARLLS